MCKKHRDANKNIRHEQKNHIFIRFEFVHRKEQCQCQDHAIISKTRTLDQFIYDSHVRCKSKKRQEYRNNKWQKTEG